MPMGIVSDKDFHKELGDSNIEKPRPTKGEIIDSPSKGRGTGNVEVPDTLRKVIGDDAINNGRQSALAIAQNFGISPSSVSAYSQGATSTASYENRPNEDVIKGAKERISKRARGKLMAALRHLTDDKIESAKARDIAGIAKDMSAIVKNMESDAANQTNNQNGPTFVFYSPQFRKETAFDTVHVNE